MTSIATEENQTKSTIKNDATEKDSNSITQPSLVAPTTLIVRSTSNSQGLTSKSTPASISTPTSKSTPTSSVSTTSAVSAVSVVSAVSAVSTVSKPTPLSPPAVSGFKIRQFSHTSDLEKMIRNETIRHLELAWEAQRTLAVRCVIPLEETTTLETEEQADCDRGATQ